MHTAAAPSEFSDVARQLTQFAERAAFSEARELLGSWPGLERRLLACLRSEMPEIPKKLPAVEAERLRNLAWEVGVSVDMHAVHLRALAMLARLFGEHVARLSAVRRRADQSELLGLQ
jgi:hypothetical protein